jgi:hypothetical protein
MGTVAIGAYQRFSRCFFLEQGLMDGPGLEGLFGMAVPASMRLFYPELKLGPEGAVRMALVGELLMARSALERPVDRQGKGVRVHIGRYEVAVRKFFYRSVLPVTFEALLVFLVLRNALTAGRRCRKRQNDNQHDPYHVQRKSHAVLSIIATNEIIIVIFLRNPPLPTLSPLGRGLR